MADVSLVVQVPYGLAYLPEEVARLVLGQDPLGRLDLDVLVKTDPAHKLLHQVDVFGGLEVLMKLHDISVIEALHAHDLPLHCLPLGGIVELILGVDLDSHLLLGLLVLC